MSELCCLCRTNEGTKEFGSRGKRICTSDGCVRRATDMAQANRVAHQQIGSLVAPPKKARGHLVLRTI